MPAVSIAFCARASGRKPVIRWANLPIGAPWASMPTASMTEKAGIDRLSAIHSAIELVQRGGTVSLSGVYGGAASPMPLIQMFDKQLNLRMGQANVKRWIDDLLPLVTDDSDPLGVEDFATHHVPLDEAPHAYEIFQKKEDGAFKVLLKP